LTCTGRGLWVWPVLLVFAVSSISFNLPTIYTPVMKAMGARDANAVFAAPMPPAPRLHPKLDLAAAQQRGAAGGAGSGQGGCRGQERRLRWLWNAPAQGVYIYGFTTQGEVSDLGGSSRLAFDSDTGALVSVQLADTAPRPAG
jgi:hypothetical protein